MATDNTFTGMLNIASKSIKSPDKRKLHVPAILLHVCIIEI